MTVLVTGGAGYIGSHTTLALLEAGEDVVALDNLSNGSAESLHRVERLTGKSLTFVEGDLRNTEQLCALLQAHAVHAVLHFAGLKAVGESVEAPLRYYDNNVAGTLSLCRAMADAGVRQLVFSSSATVYGDGHPMPLHEGLPTGQPTNPYGRSKLMVEQILADLAASDSRWAIACLRYFNPIGAHPSGEIGEDPQDIPNNLLPFVAQVAVGRREALSVFGDDYPTPDGTGVRDYIHVMDLAEGHLCALQALGELSGLRVWNLGTGQGHSVLEVVDTFARVSGRKIPWRILPRRPGDVAACWADPTLAERELGWRVDRDLRQMIEDTWRWQRQNPRGYRV